MKVDLPIFKQHTETKNRKHKYILQFFCLLNIFIFAVILRFI